ncbi:unnamed protein product, partial [Phyllotreta striolata]
KHRLSDGNCHYCQLDDFTTLHCQHFLFIFYSHNCYCEVTVYPAFIVNLSKMDCSTLMRSYSRYMLILFNLIFVLTGIIIISIGLSAKAYFHEFDELMNNRYFLISDLLIVIGVVIFFIAFFGCCGAMKENNCMTTTYSTLLVIIFLLELAVGITGIFLKSNSEEFLKERLDSTLGQYKNDSFNETTAIWDAIQKEFTCCGVVNYTDWKNVTILNGSYPVSCCPVPPGATELICTVNHGIYREGCLEKFGDFVKDNLSYVEGVAIGLAIIQLMGIIFSCCLAKYIRSDYETV